MPSGNVCRANQKRERNAAKADASGKVTTAEDRKKHEAVCNAIKCPICFQGFPAKVGEKELQNHVDSKHAKLGKTLAEIFGDLLPKPS